MHILRMKSQLDVLPACRITAVKYMHDQSRTSDCEDTQADYGFAYSIMSKEPITKTRLFKYIENFTSKNRKFSDKKTLIFFIFLLKTYIVGTR